MNIAFVSDAIYPYNKGGKEKQLYELTTRLAAAGHDVHIYTMHWWKSADKSRIEDGVHLHAISNYHDMYNGQRRSIKEGLLFGLACFKLLAVKFDVLDVDHMPYFPLFSTWIVCGLRRKRLYATWHEALSRKDWTTYMGVAGNIAALIERLSIHLPYRVIAGSSHTQELIKSELKRTKRISLIPSGIDIQLISMIKPATTKCDVLYAGRLVKDKNVDMLIRAIHIIAQKQPETSCVIIGHGIEKSRLTKLIDELNLSKNVRLLNPLPRAEDVYAYMKSAKVFCLPSSREGFGIAALEALACGTPVVTINSPANAAKDLINQDLNGSVVPLNVIAVANALANWLSKDKPLGIAEQVTKYDWDSLAKKQAEVYSI